MKKTLIIASLLAAVSAPAFAQSASTSNTATIGVQSNTQVGDFNMASNTASIAQTGVSSAFGFGPGGLAQANNAGTIGAQTNFQNGVGNFATNAAHIGQFSDAAALGHGVATVGQAATIGAQINDQYGWGNVGANAATITQTGSAFAEGFYYPLPPVMPMEKECLALECVVER